METLFQRLTRHEGLRLKPYVDTKGKITIGVGRNLTDVGISYGESAILLSNDVRIAQAALLTALPWTKLLPSIVNEVLVELVFSMGIGGLLGFHSMLASLMARNWNLASIELLHSQWARDVGPARSNDLATLLRDMV